MTNEEYRVIVVELEALPSGGITYKRINGNEYAYYQWCEAGRQRSRRNYFDRQVISEMDAGMRGKKVLYVDSAIARNIQHSLKRYQHEGHFGRCGNYMNRTN